MRLLDADVLNFCSADFDTYEDYSFTFDMIDNAPTIEAEPVIHAHWIPQYVSSRGNSNKFMCSNCNEITPTYKLLKIKMLKAKYCQHCGAKMDEEATE